MKSSEQAGWWLLPLVALLVLLGTYSTAQSWNDASRLASIQSLVDRGTWTIDDSSFVRPPQPGSGRPSPYAPADVNAERGTLDKLYIDGHYYSDKSPVPTVLLSGFYALLRGLDFPRAEDEPGRFCWTMSVVPMGLSFLLAIGCVWAMGKPLGLTSGPRLLLTASFALATMAWSYSLSLNNHLLLLGVTAAIWLELAWLTQGSEQATTGRFLRLGLLAGLAYSIDLGAGPPIAAMTFLLVLWRGRSFKLASAFVLAALPCFLLHHAIGYMIGGTWKPINAVPEYLAWPGSPHNLGNMSGVWAHDGVADLGLYALDMLFGKKGFILHNLPLLVVLVGLPFVMRRVRERAEMLAALAMCAGVWAMYSLGSSNLSGGCVSIRWFVPLLAPSFFLLALVLREQPDAWRDLAITATGGLVLACAMAWVGPWSLRMVPGYWPIVAGTVLTWGAYRVIRPFSADSAEGTRLPGEGSPIPGTEESRAAA